jgi:hypothetical protein
MVANAPDEDPLFATIEDWYNPSMVAWRYLEVLSGKGVPSLPIFNGDLFLKQGRHPDKEEMPSYDWLLNGGSQYANGWTWTLTDILTPRYGTLTDGTWEGCQFNITTSLASLDETEIGNYIEHWGKPFYAYEYIYADMLDDLFIDKPNRGYYYNDEGIRLGDIYNDRYIFDEYGYEDYNNRMQTLLALSVEPVSGGNPRFMLEKFDNFIRDNANIIEGNGIIEGSFYDIKTFKGSYTDDNDVEVIYERERTTIYSSDFTHIYYYTVWKSVAGQRTVANELRRHITRLGYRTNHSDAVPADSVYVYMDRITNYSLDIDRVEYEYNNNYKVLEKVSDNYYEWTGDDDFTEGIDFSDKGSGTDVYDISCDTYNNDDRSFFVPDWSGFSDMTNASLYPPTSFKNYIRYISNNKNYIDHSGDTVVYRWERITRECIGYEGEYIETVEEVIETDRTFSVSKIINGSCGNVNILTEEFGYIFLDEYEIERSSLESGYAYGDVIYLRMSAVVNGDDYRLEEVYTDSDGHTTTKQVGSEYINYNFETEDNLYIDIELTYDEEKDAYTLGSQGPIDLLPIIRSDFVSYTPPHDAPGWSWERWVYTIQISGDATYYYDPYRSNNYTGPYEPPTST